MWIWIILIIALIWGINSGLKEKNKDNSIYLNLGSEINIKGVTFYNNGANCYVDSTGSLIYGRNKGLGDCYWLAPTLNITQEQFFNNIKNLPSTSIIVTSVIPQQIRKVSRKRTV